VVFAFALAGCIAPPNRDLNRDKDMERNKEMLEPEVRAPIDAKNASPGDPAPPPLEESVRRLASPIQLERMQADNRLKQAGMQGLLAVAEFLHTQATAEQLTEAVRFLVSAELSELEAEQAATLREAIAVTLGNADSRVRIPSARALKIHGPGAQRTVFLTAIADAERRVRWEVVQRFSENPTELNKTQRSILLGYLEADTREAFAAADADKDGQLSRGEYSGTQDEFARLDRDRDGAISAEEWASPVPSEIRADVTALLFRLHSKLTPKEKPPEYNPWLPSSDQLDNVRRWRQWSEQLP
jgi:hypothetical protein